jgi:membrane protease YdiL (CAAX protease family)
MSQESSHKPKKVDEVGEIIADKPERHWLMIIVVPALVVLSFFLAQFVLVGIFNLLSSIGIQFVGVNESVFNSVITALVYVLTFVLVVVIPWLTLKSKTNRKELGLDKPMSWGSIGMVFPGFVAYILLSVTLLTVVAYILPGIDLQQEQDVGFNALNFRYEYVLAFITLVIIAPFAEEVLFRGYMYGKLRKTLPLWVSMLVTSLVFGLVHMAWNVGIDTFALSIVLCLLREFTGSIWSSVLLHMLKNGIAFFFIFIYPVVSATLGA